MYEQISYGTITLAYITKPHHILQKPIPQVNKCAYYRSRIKPQHIP